MASKKAGRLAGLAALAGLAYMANKKGEGAKDTAAENNRIADARAAREEEKGPASMPSDEAKKPAVDLGEIRDEAGTLSKLRRNTETGEMYDPIGSTSGKSAAAKVAAPAKTPSASTASQTGRFAPSGSPVLSDNPRKIGNAKAVVAQGGDRSARADMSKPAQTGNAKPVVAPGGDRSVRSDNARPVFAPGGNRSVRNLDYENDETKEMKRGGKVKKMASGGMTSSASKRADGIATKGKTRGRMC